MDIEIHYIRRQNKSTPFLPFHFIFKLQASSFKQIGTKGIYAEEIRVRGGFLQIPSDSGKFMAIVSLIKGIIRSDKNAEIHRHSNRLPTVINLKPMRVLNRLSKHK